MKLYYVYILTNKRNGTLYTGVTSNLQKCIYEQNKLVKGFTQKYSIDKLVYFEETNDVNIAIQREKQLKAGSRKKKLELIESHNPQ